MPLVGVRREVIGSRTESYNHPVSRSGCHPSFRRRGAFVSSLLLLIPLGAVLRYSAVLPSNGAIKPSNCSEATKKAPRYFESRPPQKAPLLLKEGWPSLRGRGGQSAERLEKSSAHSGDLPPRQPKRLPPSFRRRGAFVASFIFY